MAKRKVLWDNYKVIGATTKSERAKTVVYIGCKDGVKHIIIREFVMAYTDDSWRPTKKSISIPIKIPVEAGSKIIEPFNNLLHLLLDAVTQLEDFPLEDEENKVYVERTYN